MPDDIDLSKLKAAAAAFDPAAPRPKEVKRHVRPFAPEFAAMFPPLGVGPGATAAPLSVGPTPVGAGVPGAGPPSNNPAFQISPEYRKAASSLYPATAEYEQLQHLADMLEKSHQPIGTGVGFGAAYKNIGETVGDLATTVAQSIIQAKAIAKAKALAGQQANTTDLQMGEMNRLRAAGAAPSGVPVGVPPTTQVPAQQPSAQPQPQQPFDQVVQAMMRGGW